MTDYDTHIGTDGLWIPPEFREFTAQIVFRTPRATIQHFQRGGGQMDGYYGSIDESHFGDPEEMLDPRNAHLAPNKVSIKPQGEEATILVVDTDGPPLPDGGREGHNAGTPHGGEPWWVVVAEYGEDDYASAAVDAPDRGTATAHGERIIVSQEERTPDRICRTTGPFPTETTTENREERPKLCHGCGLQRWCGNHAPTPVQTWWYNVDDQSDEDNWAWECISCGTLTRMPKKVVARA